MACAPRRPPPGPDRPVADLWPLAHPLPRGGQLDYQYVAGWSLARDVEILLATCPPSSRAGAPTDLHLHILHVTEASWAGTLQVVRASRRDQAAGGHAVTFAYSDPPRGARRPRATPALESRRGRCGWARRSPVSQLEAGRALRRLVRERRPDMVHLHSSLAGAVGAVALPRGVPLVYTPHGSRSRAGVSAPSPPPLRAVEAFVARRCGLVGRLGGGGGAGALAGSAPRASPSSATGSPSSTTAPRPPPERYEPAAVAMGRSGRAPPRRDRPHPRRVRARRPRRVDRRRAGPDEPVRAAAFLSPLAAARGRARAPRPRPPSYLHWSEWDGQSLAILEAIARDVVVVASDIPANREVLGPRQVCATSVPRPRSRAPRSKIPRCEPSSSRTSAAAPQRSAPADVRRVARASMSRRSRGGERTCKPARRLDGS